MPCSNNVIFCIFSSYQGGSSLNLKRCTYCQEEISNDTVRCPYCCSILKQQTEANINNSSNQQKKHESLRPGAKIRVNKPTKNHADSNDKGTSKRSETNISKQIKPSRDNKHVGNVDAETDVNSVEHYDNSVEGEQFADLKNWKKVLITALTVVFPIAGQLFGIVYSLVTLCCVDDADRKSFAKALLFAAITVFLLLCFFLMVISVFFVALFAHKIF